MEIPILYSLNSFGEFAKTCYGIIVLIAILTSAISAGFGVVSPFMKKKYYTILCLFLCIFSVLFSKVGFSNLVALLYPLFGLLGIIQILSLLLKKDKKTDITWITKD